MTLRPAAILVLAFTPAFASTTSTVTRLVDGDTLVVAIAGRQEKVRLIGVDTPETVQRIE
jgi:micrococcal nuclease